MTYYCIYVNSFHNFVKFTHEKDYNTMNFLDITLIRNNDNNILFKHYKKPTYTGRIINFLSNQPYHYKFNTVVNLRNNWLKLSSPQFHNEILDQLTSILKINSYPSSFVRSVINY